jgi:transposase
VARQQADWALGFADETWWSRCAQPQLHTWANRETGSLRLIEQERATADPDPKALACYGARVRRVGQPERVWLRFVQGRPVSALTEQFLAWCCTQLQEAEVRVWVLIWDNASWHVSKRVRAWIHLHNQRVKQSGQGVRILNCYLPVKSPWLNPSEPKWSIASAPSSSQPACSAPKRSLTGCALITAVSMRLTSRFLIPFSTRSVDHALGTSRTPGRHPFAAMSARMADAAGAQLRLCWCCDSEQCTRA